MHDLTKELDLACDLAVAAGEATLNYFGSDIEIHLKTGDEPFTAADKASEAIILNALRTQFPDDGILSEEQHDHGKWYEKHRVWVIDPLDGTRDFIAGRKGFSVMIGLLVAGRPKLGVVYQPVDRILYAAANGQAFMKTDKDSHVMLCPSNRKPPDSVRLVASCSHYSPKVNQMKNQLGIVDEIRIGSVGVKIGLIASGDRDLYLNPDGKCKLWDICAPEAIVTQAGGKMTDFSGNPLVYHDPAQLRPNKGIIASNGACHQIILDKLAPTFDR